MFSFKLIKFISVSIGYISALSILIPLISATLTYNKQNKTLKRLSVFILFSVFTESVALYYGYNGWNNMAISHLYAFIQVPLLAWIFSSFIGGLQNKIILFSTISYLLFSIINLIFWEDLDVFNSNQRYFAAVVIIMFCSFYFIQVFVQASVVNIELESNFWMSAAILIYTAGTLFLFILKSELMEEGSNDYWYVNGILNIILNIGLTVSLWVGTRKSD